MPAAAASREISAIKPPKSPPQCAADADLANEMPRTSNATRHLIMLLMRQPFFNRRCDTRMLAGAAAIAGAIEKTRGLAPDRHTPSYRPVGGYAASKVSSSCQVSLSES